MPSLPHSLGPYRLDKALGRGGMGIVFEAYDQRLDRRVAVKRLLAGIDDAKRRARLRREARTTAQLAHPAIVQVFDLIEDQDGDWIVMERVDGISLAAVLKQGPLDIDTALSYGRQIADGLAAAHELGIVHRDLKTENVMISRGGRVKILDFGIAKQVGFIGDAAEHDLSKTGEIVGTSRAMSPEQARGLGVGPKSDLFSLGVLLYETLTGVSPFRAATAMDTLTRVVSHHPQPVDELVADVPSDLANLVERLLRKAPELRPAGAEEVASTLGRWIDARKSEPDGSQAPVDEPATVFATDAFPADGSLTATGSREPSFLSESAFKVSTPPSRRTILLTSLLVLVGALAWLTATRSSDPVAAESAFAGTPRMGHPTGHEPSRIYEDTMRSLGRTDKPANLDRAIEVFRGLIERDPESAAAHAGLARAYWEKSRNAAAGGDPVFLTQALALAQEAVRINPYLADAQTSLGLVLYADGHQDEAEQHLKAALEMEPGNADAQYGLGKLAEARGRSDEAESFYRRAGELRPIPIYFNALGAMLYDHGRYDEAEAAFLQSLDVAADDLHALRNLGALYFAQGHQEKAATMLQAALKIRPDASLFSNLGTILFSRGLYSQAAAAFEDALLMDGAANRYIYWLNLADAYRQLPDRSEEAARTYHRAIQMLGNQIDEKPSDVRLRSRRALAQIRVGSCAKAEADVAHLRRSGTGGDLYSLFRLAVAEELCGERDRALAVLGQAMGAGFSSSEIRLEPDLVGLRADPRYHHLLVEHGETP